MTLTFELVKYSVLFVLSVFSIAAGWYFHGYSLRHIGKLSIKEGNFYWFTGYAGVMVGAAVLALIFRGEI